MSTVHGELLGPRVTKKRVITLIILSAILISVFAYSVVIFSWILGSPRLSPNEFLDDADPENPILIEPPIPWDLQDFRDLLESLGIPPEDLDEYLDEILDLIDGNIDELDLSDMGDLLSLLALSDIETFRIYNYDSYNDLLDNLWKYECYEEYTGTSWDSSYDLENYEFISFINYSSYYSSQDLLQISMPLSPSEVGPNSFMIPVLFPNPFVIENSVFSNIIDFNSTIIRKSELNSTTLVVNINNTIPDRLTYEMFGLDIVTLNDISPFALKVDYNTPEINNTYLQLPPNINDYILNNLQFQADYNNLQTIITSSDNAAQIALKIKQYLEDNFIFNLNASQDHPQGDTEDNVNWFCTYREGVWSDFASAYSAFTRVFGVGSRFVNGFQTRFAEENITYNYVPIRYRDMYNWAEVYIPTSASNGEWIQVDVCENIDPTQSSSNYTLTVTSNFTSGYRNSSNWANITAKLDHPTDSVENRPLHFQDEYMDENIGTILTDQNGYASTIIEINNSQSVGIHLITTSFSLYATNFTTYTVFGNDPLNDLNLTIGLQSNASINLSLDPTVTINGSLFDPINNKKARYSIINYTLIDKITQIPLPGVLSPSGTDTVNSGLLYDTIWIDNTIPAGKYELQAIFLGIWDYGTEILINDTSNKIDLNITKDEVYSLWFYINDYDAYDAYNPEVSRYSTIELKARLTDESGTPQTNAPVGFYNSTDYIGGSLTNGTGWATFYYIIDGDVPAGPNWIYASYVSEQNGSYYILNQPINFNNMSPFPNPAYISRVSGYGFNTFTISGYLRDELFNSISYGRISVHMYDGFSDVSASYLQMQSLPDSTRTDQNGYFSVDFSVVGGTPTQNYTIGVIFDGEFNYPLGPFFNFPAHSNFNDAINGTQDLEVYDPLDIEIYYLIDGNSTRSFYDDANLPNRYTQGDDITLEVTISQGGAPVLNDTVRFYDVDQGGSEIDSYTYTGSEVGYYSTIISTIGWLSGIHQIRVTWGVFGVFNSTYIIINKTVTFNVNSLPPISQSISRGSESFIISGTIADGTTGLRGLGVGIHLFNSLDQDLSSLLVYEFGYQQNIIVDDSGYFEFRINNINQNITYGSYTIRIDFNGTIFNFYLGSGIDLSDYMIHSASTPININVTAGSFLSGSYNRTFIPYWYVGDTCEIDGNLAWDNGTGISNVFVQVIVYDDLGGILNSTTVLTNFQGDIYTSFLIGSEWDENSEVWIHFYPSDTFSYPEAGYFEESHQEIFLQT
ncbi:MAG: transglutaminase domain-containing protein [Candidatus Lokiarchaeota archaeon]|nr:transglutaminase domain-containing protein [Candidatus Lokiarchaeota archaeon]